MKNVMKKTNVTKALYTSLIAGMLVSTSSLAAIPTMKLLKAEPVSHINLKSVAEDNLMQSFSVIELDTSFIKINAKNKFVVKKAKTNKNTPITLSKISLIAD